MAFKWTIMFIQMSSDLVKSENAKIKCGRGKKIQETEEKMKAF